MRVGVAVVVAAVALVAASTSRAGEVYRWTDAQGVLHIADVPPPSGHKVETQELPDAPPRVVAEAPATPPATPAAATPSTPAAGTPVAGQVEDKGPARVVITEKNEEPLGDSQHGISGKVENKGGATAHDVVITVRVVSPAQGDECVNEEIDVSPSTLAPGEKAEFSADFDSPCFRGPTQVDVRPQWH
jgi:hypothetical protein